MLRLKNGVKAIDVAKLTKIHPSTLSAIENFWKSVPADLEKKIKDAIEALANKGGDFNG